MVKKLSILGGCASQLIAQKYPHVKAAGLTNWLSIASPLMKGSENVSDDFINGLKLSDYDKRIMRLDLRKEFLHFLTEEKADYLLINCNDCRHRVIVNEDAMEEVERLTCLTFREGGELENQYKKMLLEVDPHRKYKIMACYDVDMRYYEIAVDYVCGIIKQIYHDDEIILHLPNYVEGYVYDDGYHEFQRELDTENVDTEKIVSFVQERIKKNFPKCHVINFPDNVLGDPNHFLGLHPLHYHSLYYKYGSEALRIIFENHQEEINLLEQLRRKYSEKFIIEKEKLIIKAEMKQLENKIDFMMDTFIEAKEGLCVDFLKRTNNFSLYLDILSKVYKNYVLALAVRDTPGLYDDKLIMRKLHKLGFKKYPNQLWQMYVGLICGGITVLDCPADVPENPVIFDFRTNEFSIHLESHAYRRDDRASIKIDDVEYSMNCRGINLVVYDVSKRMLIDSITFDTHIMDFFSRY